MTEKDKRQEIVETAAGVFLRHGYRKTTLDDIAEAAHLQKSSLYHYFSNKDELFREIVKYIHGQLYDTLSASMPGTGTLRDEIETYLDVLSKEIERLHPHKELFLEEVGLLLPIAQDLIITFEASLRHLLEKRIAAAVTKGELSASCPVKELTTVISYFLERVFKAREFSEHYAIAADNALHYVLTLFEPYFTSSSLSNEARSS
ncbi:TetR/AcrR family transcriptional regulator [bacterium]|nr:TetR/AcrR family transcriptional regulator [bacterium]